MANDEGWFDATPLRMGRGWGGVAWGVINSIALCDRTPLIRPNYAQPVPAMTSAEHTSGRVCACATDSGLHNRQSTSHDAMECRYLQSRARSSRLATVQNMGNASQVDGNFWLVHLWHRTI